MSDVLKGLEIAVDLAAKMPILHPVSRQQIRATSGDVEAFIELLSSDSPVAAKKRREVMRRRLNMRGRGRLTPEELEAENLEQLVALTKSWQLITLDGTPIELDCTPDNVRKLYTNEKMSWLRGQVDEFVNDIANFSPALSTN